MRCTLSWPILFLIDLLHLLDFFVGNHAIELYQRLTIESRPWRGQMVKYEGEPAEPPYRPPPPPRKRLTDEEEKALIASILENGENATCYTPQEPVKPSAKESNRQSVYKDQHLPPGNLTSRRVGELYLSRHEETDVSFTGFSQTSAEHQKMVSGFAEYLSQFSRQTDTWSVRESRPRPQIQCHEGSATITDDSTSWESKEHLEAVSARGCFLWDAPRDERGHGQQESGTQYPSNGQSNGANGSYGRFFGDSNSNEQPQDGKGEGDSIPPGGTSSTNPRDTDPQDTQAGGGQSPAQSELDPAADATDPATEAAPTPSSERFGSLKVRVTPADAPERTSSDEYWQRLKPDWNKDTSGAAISGGTVASYPFAANSGASTNPFASDGGAPTIPPASSSAASTSLIAASSGSSTSPFTASAGEQQTSSATAGRTNSSGSGYNDTRQSPSGPRTMADRPRPPPTGANASTAQGSTSNRSSNQPSFAAGGSSRSGAPGLNPIMEYSTDGLKRIQISMWTARMIEMLGDKQQVKQLLGAKLTAQLKQTVEHLDFVMEWCIPYTLNRDTGRVNHEQAQSCRMTSEDLKKVRANIEKMKR
ncbi:hypothetical protein DOTSEDRAFT_77357 [Dothistroma septosporum NZE10]|uniref:Uncharacterized protein n=1 Tax=Dothistroma septosporum (strain NZE10 / CBS 128990) TaxID=675120 RepID=N1Q3F9_DOTSN|nr:hypothetical protein DOTSEDRAFT_77357 [Dothistroma septosporum NZE10]